MAGSVAGNVGLDNLSQSTLVSGAYDGFANSGTSEPVSDVEAPADAASELTADVELAVDVVSELTDDVEATSELCDLQSLYLTL